MQRMAKVTKLDLTFDAKLAGVPRKFTGIAYVSVRPGPSCARVSR